MQEEPGLSSALGGSHHPCDVAVPLGCSHHTWEALAPQDEKPQLEPQEVSSGGFLVLVCVGQGAAAMATSDGSQLGTTVGP